MHAYPTSSKPHCFALLSACFPNKSAYTLFTSNQRARFLGAPAAFDAARLVAAALAAPFLRLAGANLSASLISILAGPKKLSNGLCFALLFDFDSRSMYL